MKLFSNVTCQGLTPVAMVLAAVIFSCTQCSKAAYSSAGALLPTPPIGWKTDRSMKFSGLALSDYINGGAEVYFAYRFQELAVRELLDESGSKLTVEIYRMDRPENAFGVFSTDSSGESWNIGADSSYGDGLLRYWKGPYFVRILGFPPTPETEAATRVLGGTIAQGIHAESRRPDILRVLPEERAIPYSICYFHRQTSLNNICFLSDENLLHLSDNVDALTWKQENPGQPQAHMRIITIRYPSETAAREAMKEFREKYMRQQHAREDARDIAVAKAANGSYAGAASITEFLAIVISAGSPDSAEHALEQVQKKISSSGHAQGGGKS